MTHPVHSTPTAADLSTTHRPPTGTARGAVWGAALVLIGLSLLGWYLWLQPTATGHRSRLTTQLASSSPAQLEAATAATSKAGPDWASLNPAQQHILAPLRAQWQSLGALTKRRWLLLADRYPQLSPGAQVKLQQRLQGWAQLSTQQRQEARLNFAHVQRLTPEELQAKWLAYQALSQAEKQRLAEEAAAARKTTPVIRQPRRAQANRPKPAPAAKPPASKPEPLPTPAPATAPPPKPVPTAPTWSGADEPLPDVISAPVITPHAAPAIELPALSSATPSAVQVPQEMYTMELPALPLESAGQQPDSSAPDSPTPEVPAPEPELEPELEPAAAFEPVPTFESEQVSEPEAQSDSESTPPAEPEPEPPLDAATPSLHPSLVQP